jgi:hypothetical protein
MTETETQTTQTHFSGGWRGDPGHENDPGNVAYDVSGGRTEAR